MSECLGNQHFEKISCGQCGIVFWCPLDWVVERRDRGENGKTFWCPNGHSRVWTESTLDKTIRERDRLKQENARLADEYREAEARAQREAKRAKRIQKRAQAALCPCCNRHFSQLERHMKSKHPDVVKLQPRKQAS